MYQIDQSGKVEQTSKDTVLCLANNEWDAIIIKAKTKRQIQEIFRRNGQPRNFVLFTFCAGLAILIERNLNAGRIVIDREYYGKEAIIKKLIGEMSYVIRDKVNIDFGLIGKLSKAHFLYGEVKNKKKKPNFIATEKRIMRIIKKTEVGKQLKDT
jgi:hypothetical protein